MSFTEENFVLCYWEFSSAGPERQIDNLKVTGSIPVAPTKLLFSNLNF